jgi:hypothetical protein
MKDEDLMPLAFLWLFAFVICLAGVFYGLVELFNFIF